MKVFNDFINMHKDETISVLGLGESICDFVKKENKGTTIGVNDIDMHIAPDYLVCLDLPHSFPPSRWEVIKNTNAKYIFSHRDLGFKEKQVEVSFRSSFDYQLSNQQLNKSIISPFVACVIAYWMGAKRIEVYGVDMNTHHIKHNNGRIIRDFKNIAKEMSKYSVELVQMNPNSAIQW